VAAVIIDGRETAKILRQKLNAEINTFKAQTGITPTLALLRVGDDPASVSYAGTIERGFKAAGLGFMPRLLPVSATQAEVVALVKELNADPAIHGIMIQEPLPEGLDQPVIIAALAPDKDVDGVHPLNTGRLAQAAPVGRIDEGEETFFVPATPAGGLALLKQHQIEIAGRHAVVVGRSIIVGKPMALLLLRENATVTICHSRTQDLPALCRQADILCTAIGRARLVQGDWIKPGATVIDFGVNFENGKMCGDVDFEQGVQVAGFITPMPGGTGPMTIVMLMHNLLKAAKRIAAA